MIEKWLLCQFVKIISQRHCILGQQEATEFSLRERGMRLPYPAAVAEIVIISAAQNIKSAWDMFRAPYIVRIQKCDIIRLWIHVEQPAIACNGYATVRLLDDNQLVAAKIQPFYFRLHGGG